MTALNKLPPLPLFNTTYDDYETYRAIENLIFPRLLEKLRLKNIDVFCAFQNHDVYLRCPHDGLYDGLYKEGKHVFLMDITINDLFVTGSGDIDERENFEKSYAVAEAVVKKFYETLPILENPDAHKLTLHDKEDFLSDGSCIDRFDLTRDQMRLLAEALGCAKEFDEIAEIDALRRAEAQEYVKAAERVLNNRTAHDIQISEIVERCGYVKIKLAKPIYTQDHGDSFGPETFIFLDDREKIKDFYEAVVYERAALSPLPRKAYDLTNKIGHDLAKLTP